MLFAQKFRTVQGCGLPLVMSQFVVEVAAPLVACRTSSGGLLAKIVLALIPYLDCNSRVSKGPETEANLEYQ